MPNSSKSIFNIKSSHRWILTVLLAWGIPSIIFWLGVYILSSENVSQLNREIISNTETELISKSYNYTIEHYFQPKFKSLFTQLKGTKANVIDLQERVIKDFKRKWPENSIEIYLFDGSGKQSQTKGSKPEHQLLFEILTRDTTQFDPETLQEQRKRINEERSKLGQLYPAPYVLLNQILSRPDTVVKLGNPKKYSYCYFNVDKSIKDNIAGILIFIHASELDMFNLLKNINEESKSENFGFIYDNKSYLPGILQMFSSDDLQAYSLQYPTNSFLKKDKLVCLNRLDDETLLVKAANSANPPYFLISIIGLCYFIGTVIFFVSSYNSIVKKNIYKQRMSQKLAALFIFCYALPIVATIFMTVQYLGKLEYTLLQEEISYSRKRLSSIDTGFNGFVTSKLVKQRNFTNELQKNVTEPDKLLKIADDFYQSNSCDSIHMLSSTSRLLYTTRLLGVEARRYRNKSDKIKAKVLETWETRNPGISTEYRNAINNKIKFGDISDVSINNLDDDNKNCRRLFTSAALAAMDFHNQQNGISTEIPRNASTMVIDSLIESTTQSFFNSATTNIGQFTNITAIRERILGYVDILHSPYNKEAWYCYASITDLAVYEREYLEEFYKKQQITKNKLLKNEQILAISDHYQAQNFPTLEEFKTYDTIIQRSKNDTGTFLQKLKINDKDLLISVLKCSNLYHYTLLYIIDFEKIKNTYNLNLVYVITIITIFFISGIIIAILLTRNIIRPVNDLTKGILAFSNKDYNFRLPVYSNDEFGYLAQACNEAAKTLSEETINQELHNLLPSSEMNCGSFIVEVANSSSRLILSDFYDFLPLKQGTYAFIIAEISGNDLKSAYLTVMLKTYFNLLTPVFSENPEEIMERLNNEFLKHNEDNRLITCLIGVIDPTNEIIKIANAGHSSPIVYDIESETTDYINVPSTPLGIRHKDKIKQHIINLKSQIAVFYSDGAVNLNNKNTEEFGYEKFKNLTESELKNILSKKEKCNISQYLMTRLEEVTEKIPWQDDITILTVKARV